MSAPEHPGEDAKPEQSAPPSFGSTVTILFSDIRGFTEYTDAYGDASAYRMLQLHNSLLKEQVALYRGHVVKTQGDSYMVSFESARTAVTCAIAIQKAMSEGRREGAVMQVGIGINTGEPVREGSDFFGGTVNLAARICGVAAPGQILISETVRAVTGRMDGSTFVDQGEFELKGFRERQRLYEVDWSDLAAAQTPAPSTVQPAASPEKKGQRIEPGVTTGGNALERSSAIARGTPSRWPAFLRTPPRKAAAVAIAVLLLALVGTTAWVGANALRHPSSGPTSSDHTSSDCSALRPAASLTAGGLAGCGVSIGNSLLDLRCGGISALPAGVELQGFDIANGSTVAPTAMSFHDGGCEMTSAHQYLETDLVLTQIEPPSALMIADFTITSDTKTTTGIQLGGSNGVVGDLSTSGFGEARYYVSGSYHHLFQVDINLTLRQQHRLALSVAGQAVRLWFDGRLLGSMQAPVGATPGPVLFYVFCSGPSGASTVSLQRLIVYAAGT